MEPRLCLVVLRAAELERSRQFYQSLGMTFREERHGSGPVHLVCELGDAILEIYPAGPLHPATAGIRIGIRLAKVDAALAGAASLGGEVIFEPKDSPWGRRAVLRDPDGHMVELLEDRPASED